MWRIELEWNDGNVVPLPCTYATRDNAEWAVGQWRQRFTCHGDPFRVVEMKPLAFDLAMAAACKASDEALERCGYQKTGQLHDCAEWTKMPLKGGERFDDLNDLLRKIKEAPASKPACDKCNGEGWVDHDTGEELVEVPCPACNPKGK